MIPNDERMRQIVDRLSDEASTTAGKELSLTDSSTFPVYYEDEDLELEMTCKVRGDLHIEGDGYELPCTSYFTGIRVEVRIDFMQPPLTDQQKSYIVSTMKSEIEEYLLTE